MRALKMNDRDDATVLYHPWEYNSRQWRTDRYILLTELRPQNWRPRRPHYIHIRLHEPISIYGSIGQCETEHRQLWIGAWILNEILVSRCRYRYFCRSIPPCNSWHGLRSDGINASAPDNWHLKCKYWYKNYPSASCYHVFFNIQWSNIRQNFK